MARPPLEQRYVGNGRFVPGAVIPFMKMKGWGRSINISGANARNAGNLSGGGFTKGFDEGADHAVRLAIFDRLR
jgi:hypothetical protein